MRENVCPREGVSLRNCQLDLASEQKLMLVVLHHTFKNETVLF